MKFSKANGKLTPKGWLKEHLKRDANGITGNLDKLFADAGLDIFGDKKVKHEEKGYWSSWWAGETRGNWMEAFIRLAFVTENAEFIARSREMVDSMLSHQSEDGYLGIYLPEERYKITKRFGELWTQSRAMRSLLCYYEYTGEERILKALIRMADNILANVKTSVFEIADEDGSKGHSLMIVDGLAYLYALTGNEKYREFCEWMYGDYCAHASQFIQDDLRTGNVLDPAIPFVGHGPHTCEMLRLPLFLYEMTGKEEYLLAFRCGERKLKKNLALSGSCKSDEFIGTYQSALVMESESRTGAFGGSIPLPTTAYEYCSTTELALDYL
ncbi:MAG: glycoside hydrolase family 127 protein, partial [Clostridia bacterium]|nr:glycoside hydrolase family 127 protein [Clostridia bacterium]